MTLVTNIYNITNIMVQLDGAAEACWAHNPEVGGSKPPRARGGFFLIGVHFFSNYQQAMSTTNLDCSAKKLPALPKELWSFINTFVPTLKQCVDCWTIRWLRTWVCDGCQKRLCLQHYYQALHWGKFYRKRNNVALCDNCCWNEIG